MAQSLREVAMLRGSGWHEIAYAATDDALEEALEKLHIHDRIAVLQQVKRLEKGLGCSRLIALELIAQLGLSLENTSAAG